MHRTARPDGARVPARRARRGLRATTLLLMGLVALAASAVPAFAGQIVYSYEPEDGDAQIRVMDDDGTNDRLLVHEDDIPGAEAVYSPYVSPGGDTILFQARTPSPGGYGLYCGFRCSGIYAYQDGAITRISQAPTDCPPGDLCFGLDTSPRITGGGGHLFYELLYGEPGGSWGAPQTISEPHYRTTTPGGGDEIDVPDTSCGEPSAITPNPAVDGQFAGSTYCVGPGAYALKVMNVDGSGEETLGYDDYEFANPAFRGDGELLVGAEDGNDPGLWLYPRDGTGGANAKRIAALTWAEDHRPFNTSPTFVGSDRVAFVWGETIRVLPTSCNACTIDQTTLLGESKGIDGLAWTSRSIPSPAAPPAGGGGGGGETPAGGQNPAGGQPVGGAAPKPAPPVPGPGSQPPAASKLDAPAKAKLARALRSGIEVPFTATAAGRLTVRATISGALAKKLRLVRKATKKPVVVARGATNVAAPGAAAVTLKFTAAAKKRLKRAKSVPLALKGTLAGTAITARTRLAR